MSFDPYSFSSLGVALSRDVNYESVTRARTAHGRAYYALFLSVRHRLVEVGGPFISDHGLLTSALLSCSDSKVKTMGKTLADLYKARQIADYELDLRSAEEQKVEKPERARVFSKRAEAAIREMM